MGKKGVPSPMLGKGRSSREKLPTHQIWSDGRWWRTEKDARRHRQLKYEWRKRPKGEKVDRPGGYGESSAIWRETHQFKRAGRYWRSEEAYKRAYNRHKLAKEASDAGLSIEDYIETRDKGREAMRQSLNRDRYLKAELKRLKKKHGMNPGANRTHLGALYVKTRDPEIRDFLLLHDSIKSTSDQKVARIRELLLDGKHTPLDILYQTALIVGIQMKAKK